MDNSKDYAHSHNPFAVAYTGLAIGDLAVEQRIAAWAELRLTVDPAERARAEAAARPFGGRLAPSPVETMERAWADAMLDHHGGVPSEAQWISDPLASRLSASLAAINSQ